MILPSTQYHFQCISYFIDLSSLYHYHHFIIVSIIIAYVSDLSLLAFLLSLMLGLSVIFLFLFLLLFICCSSSTFMLICDFNFYFELLSKLWEIEYLSADVDSAYSSLVFVSCCTCVYRGCTLGVTVSLGCRYLLLGTQLSFLCFCVYDYQIQSTNLYHFVIPDFEVPEVHSLVFLGLGLCSHGFVVRTYVLWLQTKYWYHLQLFESIFSYSRVYFGVFLVYFVSFVPFM